MSNQVYFEANKDLWNKKVAIHLESDFYDNENFIKTGNSLKQIECAELVDIAGKKILHLQCHFGQDSISLAKKGAIVTAIDISDQAVKHGRELANIMDVDVNFVLSNVLNITEVLDEEYDIIYTSYGTICWIPELTKWAENIATLLKPNGYFYMVDFHAHLHTFDWPSKNPMYDYFNHGVYHEVNAGTYANKDGNIKQDEYFWIHPMSDIISALLDKGLNLEKFKEFDFSPYNCFENLIERTKDEYVFDLGVSIPHLYELKFSKNSAVKDCIER